MENVYSWLFILSGSAITGLGSFLIASARELRSNRREFERFKRNQTAKPVNPSVAELRSEAHAPAELVATNEELVKQVSSLTIQLEESQRSSGEREQEQRRLLGMQSENRQLQEEIGRLGSQLETSERQLDESFRRIQENVDAGIAMQAEIAKLKQQLAEKETAIETLREAAERAAVRQSEKDRLQEETAYSERRAIVERHAQLQTRFAELMRQTEELTAKNTQLLKDADSRAHTLAESEESIEELRAGERNARLNNQQLIETNEQLQKEIADLRQQLATAQSQLGASALSQKEAAEWNQKLQNEIGKLTQALEQRQATVDELHDAARRCSEFESASDRLRLENQRLENELDGQRNQLDASEKRSQDWTRRNQELADRCARLERELADYEEQLADNQSKRREIDGAREQLANAEGREMIYRDRQQQLEAQIAGLEGELSKEKDKVREFDNLQKRLMETERVCRELGEENRRLRDDRAHWQERLAVSEGSQRQAGMVREQLDELQSEHARLINSTYQPTEWPVVSTEPITTSLPVGSIGTGGDLTDTVSSRTVTATAVTEEQKNGRRLWTLLNRKWRFAVLSAVGVVGIAVAMGFLGSPFSTWHDSTVAPETSSDEYSAEEVAKPEIRSPRPLAGSYETIGMTQVYTDPSENAALIGNIGPKTKLNVVGSRNGWLEIRSRHGRPPGFIRQEAAVRIRQN